LNQGQKFSSISVRGAESVKDRFVVLVGHSSGNIQNGWVFKVGYSPTGCGIFMSCCKEVNKKV